MTESGDYISRADAIEAMYKDAEAHPEHTFWTTQHEALRNIPAADVRPVVRGKWTEEMVSGGFAESWESTCSICGKSYMDIGKPNYCPNCGARMEES